MNELLKELGPEIKAYNEWVAPLIPVLWEVYLVAKAKGEDHTATMKAIKDMMTASSDAEMKRELG